MKSTKNSTKPKLNVKLLRRIQKHILEEPRRLFMNWFVTRKETEANTFIGDNGRQKFPPCGTAACIAGWAVLLHDGKDAFPAGGYAYRGAKLLGLTPYNRWNLFQTLDWPEPFRADYESGKTPDARAQVAAKRIEHFIKTGE